MLINATVPLPATQRLLFGATSVVYGLLAGAFTFGTFMLRPAMRALPFELQMRLRPLLIRRMSKPMPLLMILCLLLSGLSLFHAGFACVVCRWGAWLLALAIFTLTVTVHRPINLRILSWSPDRLPPDAIRSVNRWNRADTIRCILAIAGYVFLQWGSTR
jgi:hypothetical protein